MTYFCKKISDKTKRAYHNIGKTDLELNGNYKSIDGWICGSF